MWRLHRLPSFLIHAAAINTSGLPGRHSPTLMPLVAVSLSFTVFIYLFAFVSGVFHVGFLALKSPRVIFVHSTAVLANEDLEELVHYE